MPRRCASTRMTGLNGCGAMATEFRSAGASRYTAQRTTSRTAICGALEDCSSTSYPTHSTTSTAHKASIARKSSRFDFIFGVSLRWVKVDAGLQPSND